MVYLLIKDDTLERVLNIVLGKKTIGFVSGFEPYSEEYSKILNGRACVGWYIQIFNKYQRKGHCLNVIKQMIESSDCEYFVISKPLDQELWSDLCEKIKQENIIKEFYIKQVIKRDACEIKEDLIIRK
ncbi:MAG: hypothetical protein WC376_00470 [Candidatus Nanoarchaeia archaeon]|jgi:predicted acetyltransferase